MPQLPEKLELIGFDSEAMPFNNVPTNLELGEKLNEIIDYLGELEWGNNGQM